MSIEILFKEEGDLNDPSTDTVYDLAGCCRTCLQHECSLTPTNSWDSDSIKFCDKLACCVSGVTWAKEDVPSFICGLCIEKLRIAYDFQTICLQSDQTLQLQREASEIRSSRSVILDSTTTTDLAEYDETIGNVILNVKAEEIRSPRSVTADLVTTSDQAEYDKTIENVILSIKSEETQIHHQTLELQREASEIRSSTSVNRDLMTTTDLTECEKTIENVILSIKSEETQIHQQTLQLQKEESEIRSSRGVTLDPMTTNELAERDKTIENVILSIKSEETQIHQQTLQLRKEESVIRSSTGVTPDPMTTNELAERDKTIENVILSIKSEETQIHQQTLQLQKEESVIRSSTGVTPDPMTTNELAERDKTIENVILNLKVEEMQTPPLPHCAPVTTAAAQLEVMQTSDDLLVHWRGRICNKSYTNSSHLTRHIKTHTKKKFSCKLCDKKFTRRYSLSIHMKKHTGEKFSCKLCDRNFTNPAALNRHMKTHTGEELCCKLCDKKFILSRSLSAHMKKHTNEKFSCKLCDKKFSWPSGLNAHMKSHAGEKFSCKLCDKEFALSETLGRHMKTHTGEKFSCKLCDKKFTQSSSLYVHMKIHTGEKFSCKLCDKMFTQSASLYVHMKKHTGEKFSCKLCDKKYTQSSSLRLHMTTHTGEKFSCKLCDKKFTAPASLCAHMKTHTGDMFSCKLCNRMFSYHSSLSVHMKVHTADKFSGKLSNKFTESLT